MTFFDYSIDTHIHTEATAPYLKGDSNLTPYIKAGKGKNLKLMSITDHFHYYWQNPKYLHLQRNFIDKHKEAGLEILLGAEHTILNHKGKIGIRKKTTSILDMINLSIHWFGMGIPGFIGGTRLNANDMQKVKNFFKEKNPKGRKFLQYSTDAYINSVKSPKIRNLPKIICHAWDEYISGGLFFPEIIEEAESIFKILKEEDVAFEFNNDTCRNILKYIEQEEENPEILKEKYLLSAEEFALNLFQLIADNQLWISVSSDAHKLDNIGNLGSSIEIIEQFGKKVDLSEVKMVDKEFFSYKS